MSDGLIVIVTLAVLAGITTYLITSLARNIVRERRAQNLQGVWRNFGLSLVFCTLFLVSWAAQGIAEWGRFRAEQAAHGEPVSAGDFLVEFGQSTLENWQSEFLQLFSFVVLAALLIHRGSAESKDSDDRIERKIDELTAQVEGLRSTQKGS